MNIKANISVLTLLSTGSEPRSWALLEHLTHGLAVTKRFTDLRNEPMVAEGKDEGKR